MKYDEMMKLFRDNGFDLERKMHIFYGTFPDMTEFVKNEEGIWEKHEYQERVRGYACSAYAREENMVNEILTHVYTESKWYLDYAAKGHKVADANLESYTLAMKVFDKGVFRDVLPESYHGTGKNEIDQRSLAGIAIAGLAVAGLLKSIMKK